MSVARLSHITNAVMRWWRRCNRAADPVHKVTIIPRGMALGVTQQLPLDDRYTLFARTT